MMADLEKIVESVLDKAASAAETAEVYLVSGEKTPVRFEANRLKSIRSRQSHSICLRIFKNGRTGFAASNLLEDIDGLVSAAVETSQFGAAADFELPSAGHYLSVDTFDAAVPDIPLESMIKNGERMIARLLSADARLNCEGALSKESASIVIANSRGLMSTYRKTIYDVSLEGTLINGSDMLFIGDGMSSCRADIELEPMVESILLQLERARGSAAVKSGRMPVIFSPHGVASAFSAPLMSGFNGKMVQEGASPLGSRLGQSVFDPKFSLYDDATLPFQPHSRPFDDEGVPSQRIALAMNGRVLNFLYDLKTAARAGKHSTGSAARGSSLPVPSASAFVIGSGSTSQTEMLADVKEGLLVEHLMGAEQGNVMGGDFSGNVLLGYKIEHGKIAGRVKDTVVSGNVYELLKNIAALGNDARWIGGGLFTPSIYLPAVSVASQS
jgi:PmbA protein